jgi:Ca2+-binding RTX toxin-like protein
MDNLSGGDGNDTYAVDNAKDVVTEQANGGLDTVNSSIAYVLGAEVENLTLTGAGAIAGTGNSLGNVIVGNTAANSLSGEGGADSLAGGKGNDKLAGGAGSDTLLGGEGADILTGGAESDLFLRHTLAEGKDTITDFQTGAGGDVLDISDLLSGYSAGHEAEFVQCVTVGANTTVRVDADGALNGAKFTDVCVLTGVTTDLGALVAGDNILLTWRSLEHQAAVAEQAGDIGAHALQP